LIFSNQGKKEIGKRRRKKRKKRRFKSELSMFIPETPEDVGRMRGYLISLLEKKKIFVVFL